MTWPGMPPAPRTNFPRGPRGELRPSGNESTSCMPPPPCGRSNLHFYRGAVTRTLSVWLDEANDQKGGPRAAASWVATGNGGDLRGCDNLACLLRAPPQN